MENNKPEINEELNNVENKKEAPKKKINVAAIVVPVIILIILAVFGGVIYYAKVIKPKAEIDKEIGYKVEDYITLGDYSGLSYSITQEDFDNCVKEETNSYNDVKRVAKTTDQVTFNYTGYVDGKKDSNISQKEYELIIGDGTGIYKQFDNALVGHKKGEVVEVKTNDATEVSSNKNSYKGKNVTFELEITNVAELVSEKVTNEWVKENYNDDYGLTTVKDFYEWCKSYLEGDAKTDIWQKALDKCTMNGYPQDTYNSVKTEFDQDANYRAADLGISKEVYLKDFCGYSDKDLEQEYLNEVKSELVMWALVKKEGLTCSDSEIEQKFEDTYEECGYDSVEAMKKDYKNSEIKSAVLLDKAQDLVYKKAKVSETFKMPTK